MFEKGDYVSTEGMSEDQYGAVVKAFKGAGAKDDFSEPKRIGKGEYLIWDDENDIDACSGLPRASGKERSIEEVIG